MFKKIRPKRISDEIVEQIRELILGGSLKPGDRLPPERELAMEMGVSRPVVREAIIRLIEMGYLENLQGKGTFVRSITEHYLEDRPIHDLINRATALPEIVEVRKIYETWSAATAALRATPKELAQMEEYLGEFEEAKNKGELGHVADANFHLSISYATHNTLLVHLINSIYEMVEKVTYEIGAKMYNDPHSYQDLFDQHLAIFMAIKAKDPDKAYIKMLSHMHYIEEEIRKSIGNASGLEMPAYPLYRKGQDR